MITFNGFLTNGDKVAIYGAGALAWHANLLCRKCGITPVTFIDNYKSGALFDIRICNYNEFRQEYSKNVKVIIAISRSEEEIAQQLTNDKFYSYIRLYSEMKFADRFWLHHIENHIASGLPFETTRQLALNKSAVALFTTSLSSGGAERQWCYLAKGLKKAGLDVTLIVVEKLEAHSNFYHYLLEGTGIAVVSIDDEREFEIRTVNTVTNSLIFNEIVESKPYLFDPVSQFGARLYQLIQIAIDLRPAAIVCQLDEPNILGAITSTIIGCKSILSFRNVSPDRILHQSQRDYIELLRNLYCAIVKIPNIILTGNSQIGNLDYAKWINIETQRIHQIPNIIPDTITVSPFAGGTVVSVDNVTLPVITGVFRFATEKNPRQFVEICRRMRNRGINFKARIFGDGPLRQEIMTVIQHFKLEETILLPGLVRNVDEIFRTSTLCLHTAIFEGMPNVIVESLAAGCPVVSSNVGEIPNIVIHGVNGFLIEPSDTDGFVVACESILRDVRMRYSMATNAVQSIKKINKDADPLNLYLGLLTANGLSNAQSTFIA